jgi:hypothetical protein
MPRVLIGSMAVRRVSISLAALLVKVTAMSPMGETWPVWISQAMRVVSTRVLPEPAPASTRAEAGGGDGGKLIGIEEVGRGCQHGVDYPRFTTWARQPFRAVPPQPPFAKGGGPSAGGVKCAPLWQSRQYP